jgi:type I restriction enzyme S subunit
VKKALMQTAFTLGLSGNRSAAQKFRWGIAPACWTEVRVRSLLIEPVGNGISPHAARPEPPGIPTLNVSSIRNGICDTTAVSYIELSEEFEHAFAVSKGDFFVLRGNGNRDYVAIGGLLDREPPPRLVFSDLLIRLRFDRRKADPRFMKYLWQSSAFLRRLQSYAITGSGLWKIGQRSISRFELAIPPDTREQEEIADLFDANDALLANLRGQVAATRRLKQSLLQNLLTGRLRLKP